jgi:hypothetical protein
LSGQGFRTPIIALFYALAPHAARLVAGEAGIVLKNLVSKGAISDGP